jgi:hypothetical protein
MLNKRLLDVFTTYLQEESSVTEVLPHLNELTADLFAILARTNNRGLTKQLAEKDEARDAAFISFRDYCKSFAKEPDPVQSEAAEKLTALIHKIGWTLYKQGYTEQTASGETLVKKLTKPEYAEAITVINAESRVSNLQETDAAFEESLKLKTATEARDNILPMHDCRSRMARYLKPLLVYLELMTDVNPQAYAEVTTQIEESIEYVTTVAKARQTRKENLKIEQKEAVESDASAAPTTLNNPTD